MKKFLFSFLLCAFIFSAGKTCAQPVHAYDPNVQNIVDQVSGDSLWSTMGKMQHMNRYAPNAGSAVSGNWLKAYLEAMGFDTVYLQPFGTSYTPNVIAVKYGLTWPDSVIIAGGHYDVLPLNGPGADDNASGTAAALETGRVIASHDFKRTIKIICFGAEEQGCDGSAFYASEAAAAGEAIIGVFAPDMIAYQKPGDPLNVDIYLDSASVGFRNTYVAYTAMYVPGFPAANVTWPVGASSDVYQFWQNGYHGIMPAEGQYSMFSWLNHMSPLMHTMNDTLNAPGNSKTQAQKITATITASVAAMAELYSSGAEDAGVLAAEIFPNPATDLVNIICPAGVASSATITVCDLTGRVVLQQRESCHRNSVTQIILPVSQLAPGPYVLSVTMGNRSHPEKLFIR